MSYRHIKGLTLKHNDIRASDGGLTKTRGSDDFKSYVEAFLSAVSAATAKYQAARGENLFLNIYYNVRS